MANDFRTLLCRAITDSGLTAEEFAERVGLTPGTISKAKNGRVPSREILSQLDHWCKVLRLGDDKAKALREAAHLARATPVIRELVEELRAQFHQMSNQIAEDRAVITEHSRVIDEQKAITSLLVNLMRSKDIQIPKHIEDRL